jgi:hypothetical protein
MTHMHCWSPLICAQCPSLSRLCCMWWQRWRLCRRTIIAVQGYARQRSTAELLQEIDEMEPSAWLGKDRGNMGLG